MFTEPSNVTSLDDRRVHGCALAHCHCGREWVAVFPVGTDQLECPSCGAMNATENMRVSIRYIVDVPASVLEDFIEFTATHTGVGYERVAFGRIPMLIQNSAIAEDRGLDAYFTPIEAVLALLDLERRNMPTLLWEPACGDGAIVKPLRKHGFEVWASDIVDYGCPDSKIKDYLRTRIDRPERGIVTNPPFKLALDFAQKAVHESYYTALLLRTNFLESVERLTFFRRTPPSRIWISSRRLPMMHRFGWTGPKASSNTCHAWFIWQTDRVTGVPIIQWFDWQEHC
jgi:hypothetical protein